MQILAHDFDEFMLPIVVHIFPSWVFKNDVEEHLVIDMHTAAVGSRFAQATVVARAFGVLSQHDRLGVAA